ncbi:HutD family protein [Bdellovibrio sp. HCB209]|uniref:HutD/Ves family protein n=1 Tax=Bdellovibrio sp. HCB209 TaxID=3394354 RepID=UPI0039B49D29
MMTIIPKDSYKIMPWKNGKGTTAEIAIGPEGAQFPNDFLWRFSSAEVSNNDPFSNFPGCDRLLMITQGAGLVLNGEELRPQRVLSFAGETLISAELIEGPIVDLGVIYQRDKIQAKMQILNLSEAGTLDLKAGVHFIYCLRGMLKLGDHKIHAADTLRVDGSAQLELDGLNHSEYVCVSISEKKKGP